MREGRKPRRQPPVEAAEIPNGPPPAAVGDQSGTQLPLAAPEESEEILVRVSTDGLDAAEPGVAEPGVAEPGVAEPGVEPPAEPVAEPPAEPVADPPAEPVADPPAEPVTDPVADASLLPETAGLPPGPSPYEPAGSVPADDPSLQMRIARIQLRTGALTSARAQLETLSGRNLLDTAGAVDLAEARWRTGDLHGAGEAAVAYLDAGGGEALGFVIAAEAAYLAGRMAEARRYMDEAQLRMLTSLEASSPGFRARRRSRRARGRRWSTSRRRRLRNLLWRSLRQSCRRSCRRSPRRSCPRSWRKRSRDRLSRLPEPQLVAAPDAPAAGVEPEPTPPEAVPAITDAVPPERAAADAAERPAADSGRADAQTEVAAGVALLETGDALTCRAALRNRAEAGCKFGTRCPCRNRRSAQSGAGAGSRRRPPNTGPRERCRPGLSIGGQCAQRGAGGRGAAGTSRSRTERRSRHRAVFDGPRCRHWRDPG